MGPVYSYCRSEGGFCYKRLLGWRIAVKFRGLGGGRICVVKISASDAADVVVVAAAASMKGVGRLSIISDRLIIKL